MNLKPEPGEYAEYYHRYIKLVPEDSILTFLKDQLNAFQNLFQSINEDKSRYRYAPEKWSIKEVAGHIIDSERVFGYRALRFSRNDQNKLPGFEQNDYITNGNYSNILIEKLTNEFTLLRQSNLLMFEGFADNMWLRKGIASNNIVSVRALAYIIGGHTEHHINVLKEKYGC